MRPGKKGEVILENRLDGWYVKIGARFLRNRELVQHVKETPFNDDGEKILDPAYTEDVKAALGRVARMDHFASAPLMVYPIMAEIHLERLEQKPH
ncbi:MAG TPA: hypothetical protein VG992_00805 [Candidatus Saccharimonadales bacterium]|nr:hypothetical protein [Candidatus Saccharimonadales bacterium]